MVTANIVQHDTTRTYTPASGSGTVTDLTNLPVPPGFRFESRDGRVRYKFVLVEDADLVVGEAVCYTTHDNGYEVTADRSGGTSDNAQPAGLTNVIIVDGDFGWIQTYGLNESAMITDGGVSANDDLMAHASTDGGLDTANDADGTADTPAGQRFGHALADDTSTALAIGEVFLDCPKW